MFTPEQLPTTVMVMTILLSLSLVSHLASILIFRFNNRRTAAKREILATQFHANYSDSLTKIRRNEDRILELKSTIKEASARGWKQVEETITDIKLIWDRLDGLSNELNNVDVKSRERDTETHAQLEVKIGNKVKMLQDLIAVIDERVRETQSEVEKATLKFGYAKIDKEILIVEEKSYEVVNMDRLPSVQLEAFYKWLEKSKPVAPVIKGKNLSFYQDYETWYEEHWRISDYSDCC